MLLLLLSLFSCVRLCVTPWTAAYQASPSKGFSRQEHWSGLPSIHISHISPLSWASLPPIPHPPSHPSRSSQSTELSSLYYAAASHLLSILYMILYRGAWCAAVLSWTWLSGWTATKCTYVNPTIPVHPTLPFSSVFTCLFSTSASLFLPCS